MSSLSVEVYKLRTYDCYSETLGVGSGWLLSHDKRTSDCVAQGTLGVMMVSKDKISPLKPRAELTGWTGYKQSLPLFLLSFLVLMT